MEFRMKVLILTISAGQGHNQTASAIAESLKSKGVDCTVLDAYKYINKFLSESVEKGYLLSTKYTPLVYGRAYRLLELKEKRRHSNFFNVGRFTNNVMGKKLLKYIENYNPDVVISTHIFAALTMTHFSARVSNVINIGIITDFTVHPFWEDTEMDYYVTATSLLNYQCEKKGIEEERVLSFGIPIQKKFSKSIPKLEARRILGVDNKPTVMVMMGSMGYGNVRRIVSRIDVLELDFQVICVCGKNERAKRSVEKLNFRHKVYNYGFVDNVDVMMDASDFIITKPGGLSMSESLAKGVPAILVNPIPGQEDRNLEFLLNNGLAMAATSTFPIDEAVYHLFINRWRWDKNHESTALVRKPNASDDLSDFIIGLKTGKNKNDSY
jgi:processive 1,2-diacylglycerol beta-glucosyltransferase